MRRDEQPEPDEGREHAPESGEAADPEHGVPGDQEAMEPEVGSTG
jgi:hypothetical protein